MSVSASRSSVSGRWQETVDLLALKNGDVCKREQIDCFLPPAGVLVAAMKEQYSLVGRFVRNPSAIEQLGAVPTLHRLLNGFHWFLPTLSRRDAIPLQLCTCRSCLRCATNSCEAHRQ